MRVNLIAEAWSPRHLPEACSAGTAEAMVAGLEPGGSGGLQGGQGGQSGRRDSPLRVTGGTGRTGRDGTGRAAERARSRKQSPFITTVTLHIYEAEHHSLIE